MESTDQVQHRQEENQGVTIKLNLTVNEVNATLLALAKLPYETIAPLIDKIRTQALPQVPEDQRNDAGRAKMQQDLINAVNKPESVTAEQV
jgi:hypothetical protein